AVDGRGRQSSADQPFWLNLTLGTLRVPAVAVVGSRRAAVATFKLTRPATVTSSIESTNGVPIRKLGKAKLKAGTATVRWNGRDSRGHLVYGGRYVVRVRAVNGYGPSELTQILRVRRG